MRIVYVNGEYVTEDQATVSIFDRGFLFADGVYEVTSVLEGKLIDFDRHMERLHRSMSELKMNFDIKDEDLLQIHRDLIEKNELNEGLIYLQVTRGAADRDFAFPENDTPPSIVLFTQTKSLIDNSLAQRGQKVITIDDQRWGRCDIKTVQLLFPSLAKMEAKSRDADDAWMMRDGFVTEGTSNNAYIVTEDGRIITRDISSSILSGITRRAVLELANELQIAIEERPFTLDEALSAKEAFCTAATTFVCPVVAINDQQIGDGEPGPIAKRLREIYIAESIKSGV